MEEKVNEIEGRIKEAWAEIVKMEERLRVLPAQYETFQTQLSEFSKLLDEKNKQTEAITTHFSDYFEKTDSKTKSKIETVVEHHQNVEQFLKASSELKLELQDFRDFIYGNEVSGKVGFKADLETLYGKAEAAHKTLQESWVTAYDTLYKKIEGLLPGATSTGLAKAYEDQSKNYKLPVLTWSIIFIATMVFMIWVALSTMRSTDSVVDSLLAILARLPFFIPAIWLAIFASKQQSQYKRLSQEYAYKQTLAKSFEGYKREIQALPDGDEKNQLLDKLTTAMVEMCSFNPSATLENLSHNDRPPIPLARDVMNKLDKVLSRQVAE